MGPSSAPQRPHHAVLWASTLPCSCLWGVGWAAHLAGTLDCLWHSSSVNQKRWIVGEYPGQWERRCSGQILPHIKHPRVIHFPKVVVCLHSSLTHSESSESHSLERWEILHRSMGRGWRIMKAETRFQSCTFFILSHVTLGIVPPLWNGDKVSKSVIKLGMQLIAGMLA